MEKMENKYMNPPMVADGECTQTKAKRTASCACACVSIAMEQIGFAV